MKTFPRVWDRLLRVSKTSAMFWSMGGGRPFRPQLDPPLPTWLGHWTLLGSSSDPCFVTQANSWLYIPHCLTKFKTPFIWEIGKYIVGPTADAAMTTKADNNIIYRDVRQQPSEQTRSNCETTESRTENRTLSPTSSDRLQMNLSNP